MALTVTLTITLTVTITMRVPNPIYVACRLAQKISVVFFAGPWEVSGDGTAADAPRDSMRSSYKSWKPIDTGDARGLIHV